MLARPSLHAEAPCASYLMKNMELLASHLAAYVDEAAGHALYAVVDLARLNTPLDQLAWLKRMPGACNLFAGQPEASAETLAPWLWPIPKERRDFHLATSISLERATHAAASWIVTTLSAQELARRLGQRMTALVHDQRALFRYYDPRLLQVVARYLSAAERDQFFGLGKGRWFLVDEHDELAHIDLHDADDAFRAPARISEPLSAALQEASECTQISEYLSRSWPAEWADWPAYRRRAYARDMVLEAQQRGIDSFSRKAWYCRGKLARKALPNNGWAWAPDAR